MKLYLSLHVVADAPAKASLSEANVCERAEFRKIFVQNSALIADRYFSIDCTLFADLQARDCIYCIRVSDTAIVEVLVSMALAPGDMKAGIISHDLVIPGGKGHRSESWMAKSRNGATQQFA